MNDPVGEPAAGEPTSFSSDAALPMNKMHAGVERELVVVNRAIRDFWLACGVCVLAGCVLFLLIVAGATGLVASNDRPGPAVLAGGGALATLLILVPLVFRHRWTTLKRMKAAVLNELRFYREHERRGPRQP
jgi:hypothetical protein